MGCLSLAVWEAVVISSALNALAGQGLYGGDGLYKQQMRQFPRSEARLNLIMIRRVEARRQLRWQRFWAWAALLAFGPLAICVLIKAWTLAILWIVN